LILLDLFKPVMVLPRSLQQASEPQTVQKLVGCKRASLGSLSEAVSVFDPERLEEIIVELGTELVPLGRDPRLRDVPGLLTVVDGTLLSALPMMMEASLRIGKTGTGMVKWRRRAALDNRDLLPVRHDRLKPVLRIRNGRAERDWASRGLRRQKPHCSAVWRVREWLASAIKKVRRAEKELLSKPASARRRRVKMIIPVG
jgi:hypothetical protein